MIAIDTNILVRILIDDRNVDFDDCVILDEALSRQLTLHTFDKRLSRLHGADHVNIIGK